MYLFDCHTVAGKRPSGKRKNGPVYGTKALLQLIFKAEELLLFSILLAQVLQLNHH